jgi:hypothetical protein
LICFLFVAFQVAHLKNAHEKEVFVLELEAKKQRERTVALLAEKDMEIDRLRSSLPSPTLHRSAPTEQDYVQRLKELGLEGVSDTDGLLRGETTSEQSLSEDAVARLFSHSGAVLGVGGPQGEGPLLHFAQEKARLDVEISILRKHKHQLETGLRELQHSLTLKEEKSVVVFFFSQIISVFTSPLSYTFCF